jgi:hypothetical protein
MLLSGIYRYVDAKGVRKRSVRQEKSEERKEYIPCPETPKLPAHVIPHISIPCICVRVCNNKKA